MKKHVISIYKWNYTTVHIIATLKILKFVKSFSLQSSYVTNAHEMLDT